MYMYRPTVGLEQRVKNLYHNPEDRIKKLKEELQADFAMAGLGALIGGFFCLGDMAHHGKITIEQFAKLVSEGGLHTVTWVHIAMSAYFGLSGAAKLLMVRDDKLLLKEVEKIKNENKPTAPGAAL